MLLITAKQSVHQELYQNLILYSDRRKPIPTRLKRSPSTTLPLHPLLPLPSLLDPHHLLLIPISKRPHQPASHQLCKTQTHRDASKGAPDPQPLHEGLSPPRREQHVQTSPGGGDARGVDLEAEDVQIAGESEDGREEHGREPKGAHVLGGDDGGEGGGGNRVF